MDQLSPKTSRQRGFSFHSDKSREVPGSPKSASKASKHERKHSDRDHYDPNSKANPNSAMNELQPSTAALEKPTLQSLRSFQHTDTAGNPIADPDLSNPTRSRWERPLDTIRSFEAAIDGEYRRRAQSMRADQTDIMSGYGSRRSSYYGGGFNDQNQNRFSQVSGYYSNRHSMAMRDSSYDGYGHGGPVGGGPPPRMRYGNRMQSDPGWNNSNRQSMHGVYPMNGHQQSRDTVNTNGSNGSHSDGPYSNDPSSENSSIERGVPVKPPQSDMHEQYGFNGFGRGPIMEEYEQHGAPSGPPGGGYFPPPVPQHKNMPPQNVMPPAPPKHIMQPAPIKLNGSGAPPSSEAARPAMLSKKSSTAGDGDKRKSWFKRRFSKD